MKKEQENSIEIIRQMERAALVMENLRNMLDRIAKKTNHARWHKKVRELDLILNEMGNWKEFVTKKTEYEGEGEKTRVYREEAESYRELLGKQISRSRSFIKTIEQTESSCSLRDVFLPLQLFMGNLHAGQDVSRDKEQLIVQLRTMLLETLPSRESYIEPRLYLEDWSVQHAKREMESVWADMERLQRPVIWNRQLTERVLLFLLSEEMKEEKLREELEDCGLYARYYEEAAENCKEYFSIREYGCAYPALFVCSPEDGEWRCQSRGTCIVKA